MAMGTGGGGGMVKTPDLQIGKESKEIGAFKLDLSQVTPEFVDDQRSAAAQLQTFISIGTKLPMNQHRKIYTIVGSRSHPAPELDAFVEKKKRELEEVDFISAGSSLKICLVAEGSADIYPRLGPTMEWDTAAGQAISDCAGANLRIYETSKPLSYNKANLLNPWFIVER